MYDWPEVQRANDAFWQRIAGRLAQAGIAAPKSLSRDRPATAIWQEADLLLAQTCGLPFVTGRCGTARIVARPDYGIEGAADGLYASALVCRRGDGSRLSDFRGARAAVNQYGSQSGCNALADAVGETDFFGTVVMSGAHRVSARLVAAGEADLAAIDAVAWALFRRYEPEAASRLGVLDWTRSMPVLPFITGVKHVGLIPRLCDALLDACRGGTGLPVSALPASEADYAPVREMAETLIGRRLAPTAAPL